MFTHLFLYPLSSWQILLMFLGVIFTFALGKILDEKPKFKKGITLFFAVSVFMLDYLSYAPGWDWVIEYQPTWHYFRTWIHLFSFFELIFLPFDIGFLASWIKIPKEIRGIRKIAKFTNRGEAGIKKKLIIFFVLLFLTITVLSIFYKKFYTSTDWNYEGDAVILVANPDYEFVGTTKIKLDGEIYGFGRYYLGDVFVEKLEELCSYTGNNKVSTMYRYNLDTEGEKCFEDKEKRKRLSDQIVNATYHAEKMPKAKMTYFDWYEWGMDSRGRTKRKEVAASYFYMKEPGEMPCVLYLIPQFKMGRVITYFIVPGVSTREEAISLMKENFEGLGMGNFVYY